MKKNNKKGFTLVELVIVVAVMAILVAVAIPTISSITTKAQGAVNDSNARTIESIIKLEEAEKSNTTNTYTITVDDAVVALNEAKLGIDSGTFSYLSTGAVVYGTAAPSGSSATVVFSVTFTNGVAAAGTGA